MNNDACLDFKSAFNETYAAEIYSSAPLTHQPSKSLAAMIWNSV